MVKHIVLFKLKESLTSAEKADVMNRFKVAIEALPQKIDFIRDIRVGLNINPDEQWDICLDSLLRQYVRLAGRREGLRRASRPRGGCRHTEGREGRSRLRGLRNVNGRGCHEKNYQPVERDKGVLLFRVCSGE